MKTFKIYFGRLKTKSDYLIVNIYSTEKEYKKVEIKIPNSETAAQTFIKNKHDGKYIGYINFYERMFSPVIVSHELQHAVIHYWRFHKKRKINEILKYEEDFCDLSGWLHHWLNKELRKVYE